MVIHPCNSPQKSRQPDVILDTPNLAQPIEEFLAAEGITAPASRLQSFAAQLLGDSGVGGVARDADVDNTT